MSEFNIGSDWKTKVSKGKICENEYVKVSKGDWETYCTVKTEDGREEVYFKTELMGFGYLKNSQMVFDIVEDHYDGQDVGRTIYEGNVDWEKIKLATIKQGAVRMLNKGYNLFTEFPEIEKILTDHIKNGDEYKLSYEYE
ncbi:hypothetical protein M0Q97_13260 [Candidatus Dojkabacteria bacterium]|nr:hypothetical protein [Candidatus Dojkabacteria bacterium]